MVAVDGVDMLVGVSLLRADRDCGYKTRRALFAVCQKSGGGEIVDAK